MSKPLKLVVAWKGLPAYGARLIQAGRDSLGYNFPVLATKPDVPIQGMEEILAGNIKWIDPADKPKWSELGLSVPEIFIHTGWGYPYFLSLADEVRAQGGKVVGMFDNSWKRNLRQLVGGLYFRLFRLHKYAAVWVPGQNARRLARYIGFPRERIFEGMYGADPSIFRAEKAIIERPKRVLFVGRLIDRKGVLELADAFEDLHEEFPNWTLEIIGSGTLEKFISGRKRIELHPFQQPPAISKSMNESQIFILPSREEHWGLVVHEATLCGCALVLERKIGAAADLAGNENAVLFEGVTVASIGCALRQIFEWEDAKFNIASNQSMELAANFGPQVWAKRLKEILSTVA